MDARPPDDASYWKKGGNLETGDERLKNTMRIRREHEDNRLATGQQPASTAPTTSNTGR